MTKSPVSQDVGLLPLPNIGFLDYNRGFNLHENSLEGAIGAGMKILALDTANNRCSAAVLVDGEDAGGETIIARSEEIGRGHAERLMGMIEEVLVEAGLPLDAMDRIAVTCGPGSFTGLRVGMSVARGLGLVLDVPVVGVTTLAAIAEGVRDGKRAVAVALAARNEEVYAQSFAADGTPRGAPSVVLLTDFARDLSGDTVLAGSAAQHLAELLEDPADGAVIGDTAAADIAAVARLARRAPEPVGPPTPLYLRPPDAKPQTRFKIARA